MGIQKFHKLYFLDITHEKTIDGKNKDIVGHHLMTPQEEKETATTADGKGEAPSTLRGFNNLETVTISEL